MNDLPNKSAETQVYLKGLNYYLGDLKDISEVDFLQNDPEKLKSYYEMGFKTYSHSNIPMIEMAYQSIQKTLSELEMDPAEIDILLFVAESKHRDEIYSSYEVNMLLSYLKMPTTYPIGISLSDCANSLLGLQTAQAMVSSGQAKNVLVVCTNRASQRPGNRKMIPEVAVCGDAAVSVLVTSSPGDYKIMGSRLIKNEPTSENAPPLDVSIKKIKALRTITKSILENVGLKKSDINSIMVNNYFELSQIFVESCGFDAEIGHYDNLAKYGHCLAGDTLLSLKDQQNELKPGNNIFLLADGPYGSFAICLHKN